jgi:hypothetical protein
MQAGDEQRDTAQMHHHFLAVTARYLGLKAYSDPGDTVTVPRCPAAFIRRSGARSPAFRRGIPVHY